MWVLLVFAHGLSAAVAADGAHTLEDPGGFEQVERRLAGVQTQLQRGLAELGQPLGAARAKVQREMAALKAEVEGAPRRPESSLLEAAGLTQAGGLQRKLDLLQARIRANTAEFEAKLRAASSGSLVELDPAVDEDEAAADAIANEDGPESDAEKAETEQEEAAADTAAAAFSAALPKEAADQAAMLDKIKQVGAAPKPLDTKALAHLGQNFGSFAETDAHLRRSAQFTWASLPRTYHTFSEMLAAVDALTAPCAKAGFKLARATAHAEAVSIETVTLTPRAPTRKTAAVFGEHPRELISPETGLTLLQALCDAVPECEGCTESHAAARASLREAVQQSLQTEWLVVLNSNPLTRKNLEETSDFCLRLDPEGVDTNRNYDDHFDAGDSHGDAPFSAPEVSALQHVLADFRPNVFFSIHSGERGLYTPHAWSTDPQTGSPEHKALERIPQHLIPADYAIGAAGALQGRAITGSSFDYVRDKLGAEYSYAFELFKDAEASPYNAEGCFRYFNPATLDAYTQVTQNFAAVIMQTAHQST